jgi:hypothetical protein
MAGSRAFARDCRGLVHRGYAAVVAGPARLGALGLVTLLTWVFTACLGGFMLGSWAAGGGIQRRRSSGAGPPLAVIFGHMALAVTGLLIWASALLTGWIPLAWAGVGLLMPAIGLGLSTVTLWTPYPGPGAPGTGPDRPGSAASAPGSVAETRGTDPVLGRVTDDLLTKALTDDVVAGELTDMVVARVRDEEAGAAKRPRWHLTPLIPAAHGMAAVVTFLLAVVATAGAT